MRDDKDVATRQVRKILVQRADTRDQLVLPWSDKRLAGVDVAQIPTALVHCYLPRRKPTEDVIIRSNGDISLMIETRALAFDGKAVKPGIPYGAGGRLILAGLTTLAKLQTSIAPELKPRLYLPRSARAFFRFTHFDNTGERSSDRNRSGEAHARFMQQFYRVLAAEFTATKQVRREMPAGGKPPRVQTGWAFRAVRLVEAAELWWNPSDLGTATMWPSWLELSPRGWEWIEATTHPLDWEAYTSHAKSPLTMDIDAWLGARLWQIPAGETVYLTWEQLYLQFVGSKPASLSARAWQTRIRVFKWDFLASLKRTLAAYRTARVKPYADGIELHHSPPWVDPKKALIKLRERVEPDLLLP
jgi:Plasmid encoded RepA protein